jgi:quercetin dioxygenase-like cupin family protein
MTSKLKWTGGVVVLAIIAIFAQTLFSQNTGIQRTILQRKDISVPGREAVVARVEIAPGGSSGRHTHPGEEITYVIEGEVEILVDGQPPLKVKAGESFIIPAGAKHDARNTGTQTLKMAGVYIVDKSQPMATPAP